MFASLKKAFKKDQLILLGSGLTITLLMTVLFISQPQFLNLLELKIYDSYLKHYHTPAATEVPVIIDLDEKSLEEFGQWPWPRYRVAILMKYLQAYGAMAVVSDIIFAEPDRTSPVAIKADMKRELKVDIDFAGLHDSLMDYDKLLAHNLKAGPFVLGIDFVAGTGLIRAKDAKPHESDLPYAKVAVLAPPGSMPPEKALLSSDDMIGPTRTLAEARPRVGFITITPDEDSVYRRVPLLYSWRDRMYPSLALAALIQAMGEENMILKLSSLGVEAVRFNGVVIPTDKRGRMLINYRGPSRTFQYISASDILNKRLPQGALQGRIAFIGTTVAGLKDIRPIPLDPSYPGVEAHATIVDNILSQQFLSIPDWAKGLEFLGMVAAGLTTTLLLMWARASWLALPLIGLGCAMWYGSVLLYEKNHYFLSPLYSYIILALTFLTLTVIKYWREESAKRFIHGAFAQYLAPSVIQQIMDNPDALSLDGQEKDITIQFSDIRGFTSLSERLTPTQVTNLLQDYLTPMTRIITDNQGTLDKFIGDAVMAFWNAPVDVDCHQEKALVSALAQLEKLEELNKLFIDKYGFTIAVGIGIHSGPVRVGNMGSADLFDYTLIGDNVNLASRLEGLTKYYGQKLVVSQAIRDACCNEYRFRLLDRVRVKGKNKPVSIYTAYSFAEAQSRRTELETYDNAHDLYENKRFGEAADLFRSLRETSPERILCKIYLDRCAALMENPPGDDWDGVFTHKSK
ncbi:MAG: adenylate/guanylate cyclase domain-containing protein [Desulfovibrionaceae bacterium]|nr:adenylate/guanylate cyclase domain-containing protein [Desulfovibrionaceae bacterium]